MITKPKTITATMVIEEWHLRAQQLGWTFVSDNRCPRLLTGLHHREAQCWCRSQLGDHAATWRDADGTMFVLWEPYGADAEDLAETFVAAYHDGLAVRVIESVWNPPHTVGISFVAVHRGVVPEDLFVREIDSILKHGQQRPRGAKIHDVPPPESASPRSPGPHDDEEPTTPN